VSDEFEKIADDPGNVPWFFHGYKMPVLFKTMKAGLGHCFLKLFGCPPHKGVGSPPVDDQRGLLDPGDEAPQVGWVNGKTAGFPGRGAAESDLSISVVPGTVFKVAIQAFGVPRSEHAFFLVGGMDGRQIRPDSPAFGSSGGYGNIFKQARFFGKINIPHECTGNNGRVYEHQGLDEVGSFVGQQHTGNRSPGVPHEHEWCIPGIQEAFHVPRENSPALQSGRISCGCGLTMTAIVHSQDMQIIGQVSDKGRIYRSAKAGSVGDVG